MSQRGGAGDARCPESFGTEPRKPAHDRKLLGQSAVIVEFVEQLPGHLVDRRPEHPVAILSLITQAANLADECGGCLSYVGFHTIGWHGALPDSIARALQGDACFAYPIRARLSLTEVNDLRRGVAPAGD
jgi:hypothetical protein